MDINELRDKIDSIDSEILKLFTQRMKISLEIAK
jgi:chorismate mutase